jgi:hypothetical protein
LAIQISSNDGAADIDRPLDDLAVDPKAKIATREVAISIEYGGDQPPSSSSIASSSSASRSIGHP